MIQKIRQRNAARKMGQKGQGGQGGGGQNGQSGSGGVMEESTGTGMESHKNVKLQGGKQGRGKPISYKKFVGPGQRPSELRTKLNVTHTQIKQQNTKAMEIENIPRSKQQVVKEFFKLLEEE